MNISFDAGINQLSKLTGGVIILTGAGRSGKTTLGNILGSCDNVEHIDEPWFPMMLPIMAYEGMIAEDLAHQLFITQIVELLYDKYLMRHVNFRPQDLSSVWQQKTPKEILSRLIGLDSREDARIYAAKQQPILVLTLTNTVPYIDFFRKAYPECSVIHVVREGLQVAMEFYSKGWLSNAEHLSPSQASPYRKYVSITDGTTYYLPYWLEQGQEQRYLAASEFGRGLHYWRRIMSGLDWSAAEESGQYIRTVKFSEIASCPENTIKTLLNDLGLASTSLTKQLLSQIKPDVDAEINPAMISDIELNELRSVRQIYLDLGMSTSRLDSLLS